MDLDVVPNTYDNKLYVLRTARRNQLESEIRTVAMLSEVQADMRKVEDLVWPWIWEHDQVPYSIGLDTRI